jgi:DNA adenine methylase
MKYMGSKRRIAKHIAPIIQGFIESGNYKTYIEPFVGGANMIEAIKCDARYGSDVNGYLIELLEFVAAGHCHELPEAITEQEYNSIKNYKDQYPSWLVGFCGFNATFGSKWFGGYARARKGTGYDRDVICGKIALTKQAPLIEDVQFTHHTYKNWSPENCVVYCDPPYQKTTNYKSGDFDHADFWQWCKKYAELQYNNVILVSEYAAPEGFECIWSKEIENTLSKDTTGKKGIEKLFLVRQ